MPAPPPPEHTRFQPGKSGNPSGRPKGSTSLTVAVQKALRRGTYRDRKGKKHKITNAMMTDRIAEVVIGEILEGNTKLLEIFWDRMDGKTAVRLESDVSGTVNHQHTVQHEISEDAVRGVAMILSGLGIGIANKPEPLVIEARVIEEKESDE